MAATDPNHLRQEMQRFVAPSTARALFAVFVDYAMYLGCVVLAVTAESVWVRLFFAVLAGQLIACLFVLGHDGAHGSLTRSARLNKFLAYLCFLPALNNYTLWRLQHNRLHHRSPNVANVNSWSPLSLAEYRALPGWRRALERFYRSGLGFGLYYAVDRWWKDKLFPGGPSAKEMGPIFCRTAWKDFAVLIVYAALFIGGLLMLAQHYGHGSSLWTTLLFGLVIPFVSWNYVVAVTIYLNHTHQQIPWYAVGQSTSTAVGQEHVTVNVIFPRWYGLFTHDIMEHTAHHIHPLIPHYRLHAAHLRLREIAGPAAIVEPLSLRFVFDLLRRCKLYDYDQQQWLDFDGRPTTEPHLSAKIPLAA